MSNKDSFTSKFRIYTNKMSLFLTPIWTIVSIIAGIVWCTWFCANWALNMEDNVQQVKNNIRELAGEQKEQSLRTDKLELSFSDFAKKQDRMLYLLTPKGKHYEMVD